MSSCVKNLVVLLWIYGSFMAQPCFGRQLSFWYVEVHNEMQSGQTLFLHCKSKDDDLGQHNLGIGQQFSWRFKVNVFNTTLFWCYMRNKHNHVALEVFWPERKTLWLAYRCDFEDCVWSVRDDGIYLKNIPDGTYEFLKKWEPGFGRNP